MSGPVGIRQCAILAGGRASRLGAIAAELPKPLLPCGDRPFLAWLMRELCRYGVKEFILLAGHLAPRLEAAIPILAAALPRPAAIRVSTEPVAAGTGGALHHARDLLDPHFLLCNGDSVFDANLAPFLAAAARAPGSEIGHLLLRPAPPGGRYGVVETDGTGVTGFRARPPADALESGGGGRINAGIYRFDRRILDALAPVCSLEQAVLPALAAAGALGASDGGDGYFCDIGIPEDYARGAADIPRRLQRPALFLDRDGVLNQDHGYVGTRARFAWVAGAREAVALATARGFHVFIVTNQSGIARGLYSEADLAALHAWIEAECLAGGGTIDDWRYCPFHPEATLPAYRRLSDWRKPGPGMIRDLMARWDIDPACALLVGDQETDTQAAAGAGIAGHRFAGGNLRDFLDPLLVRRELP
ncbi:MAG: HAD-IIIA family hydrolase [Rhodospirillales bacterium]|nr:HAD-IIIA family hydrolase [Rhodospirillales bacterium]